MNYDSPYPPLDPAYGPVDSAGLPMSTPGSTGVFYDPAYHGSRIPPVSPVSPGGPGAPDTPAISINLDGKVRLTAITKEIHVRVSSIKIGVLDIGRLLVEAKRIVGFGGFEAWIKENFDFSYRSANNFMNVYQCCMGRPQLVESIKTSVLYTICAPGFPADLREYLFENGRQLEDIGGAEIQDIYRRYKASEIDLDSPEIKALVTYHKRQEKLAADDKAVKVRFARFNDTRKDVFKLIARGPAPAQELPLSPEQMEGVMKTFREMEKALWLLVPGIEIVEEEPEEQKSGVMEDGVI